jgi:hypothetical protein
MLYQTVEEGQFSKLTVNEQICQRRWVWRLPPVSLGWTRLATLADVCLVCHRVAEGQFPMPTLNKQGLQLSRQVGLYTREKEQGRHMAEL